MLVFNCELFRLLEMHESTKGVNLTGKEVSKRENLFTLQFAVEKFRLVIC